MAKTTRNFIQGRMNKSVDERLVPQGEYIDALNVRLGSTENSEIGSVENSKGNTLLVTPEFPSGTSHAWQCIGAFADEANETIYWFVHADLVSIGATTKLDMIVSYNKFTQVVTNHVVSIDDGGGVQTTLNFSDTHLINGINKVENLLFFTDNLNPPRFIDVDKNYPDPIGNIDQFSAESILVVKKPPVAAPAIRLFNTTQSETYLDERFICFAYRYKYANNEYSATSQFSLPAFTPEQFNLSLDSGLNEGMINAFNTAEITYNTGGSLVTEIQLLFKESTNNIVKIIESFNKAELGLGDNNDETFIFDNSKIFTILPDSEILRLYDNVPLLAKAQTVMGNRLMYGNYFEGYDLVDSNNNPIQFNYEASLQATDINETILTPVLTTGTYQIDCTTGSSPITTTSADAVMGVFLTEDGTASGVPIPLKSGNVLDFDFNFIHNQFTGDISGSFSPPTATTPLTNLAFTFVLPRDYTSASDLATSSEFVSFMGSPTNIKPLAQSNTGNTVSDRFNSLMPSGLAGASGGSTTTLEKCWSGTKDIFCTGNTSLFDTAFATFAIGTSSTNQAFLSIQLMAVAYVDTCPQTGGATATQICYEYLKFSGAQASFKTLNNPPSLKSNRNYEVAIVYMDEFNRSSTPIVSPNNAVAVPCVNAVTKNQIKVEIPVAMHPPQWAVKYKFCVQPDRSGYNTVYTNLFFNDPKTARIWCLLEGENAQKVEKGDRLIVKRDSSGPVTSCVYATVLEKEVKIDDFITVPIPGSSENAVVPAGAYMAITPRDFSAALDPDAVFNPGTDGMLAFGNGNTNFSNPSKDSSFGPQVAYLLSTEVNSSPTTSDPQFADVPVPQGSVINMNFRFARLGPGDGNKNCERVIYDLELTGLVAQNSYENMYDWFEGDNIESLLNTGLWEVGDSGSDGNFVYDDSLYYGGALNSVFQVASAAAGGFGQFVKTFNMRFFRMNNPAGNASTSNALGVVVRGGRACGGTEKRRSRITMSIQVFTSENTLVFETEPLDAAPGIFFEGSDTFDITGGFHQSGSSAGDQNQTGTLPGIVTIAASNCFTFGNGVESNKIRDSISGKDFNLGNRVYGATEQIYKRAHRFADITYSGIYNDESNINKLNEFNLGLVNFKLCEDIYGPIEVLSGRKTDVLTLQEDKISYVLAGKNLLSDATGGSALTSVPEVLGTQISRIEKYGISNNPESFTEWGADKFFTDAKRGAVIQLKGGSAQDERLGVVSEVGMRGYFRDLFNESLRFQKIGGFDPYMNEYVLSFNNTKLPLEDAVYACGMSNTLQVVAGTDETVKYQLTEVSGNARLNYAFGDGSGSTTEIKAEWVDGSGVTQTATSGPVSTDGFITIVRDVPSITLVTITLIQTAGNQFVTLTQDCPLSNTLNIVQVCVTNDDENTLSSFNQYFWNTFSGTPTPPFYTSPTFTSATTSTFVDFAEGSSSPVVSQYSIQTGQTGQSGFPPTGSYVTLLSNQISPANFTFDLANDKFKFLNSNTLYNNTASDITSLLNLATNATPITEEVAGVKYSAQFIRPASNTTYLYLIWDYRSVQATNLSYQVGTGDFAADTFAACCVNTPAPYFLDGATLSSSNVVYASAQQSVPANDGYYSDGTVVRLQKLGLLQNIIPCLCGVSCGNVGINWKTTLTAVLKSRHTFTSNGAVIVRFIPFDMPVGIKVTYDGVIYNKWSSSIFGDVAPNSLNTPVFLGDSNQGTPPSAGNYAVLELNSLSQYQIVPNTTQFVSVGSGQIKTTAANPGVCTIVVPATNPAIQYLDIEVYNLISNNDGLSKTFSVECPANLVSFTSSDVTRSTATSGGGACLDPNDARSLFRQPNIPAQAIISVNDQIYANNNGDLAVNTDPTSPGYGNRAFSAGGWIRVEQQANGVTAILLSDESIVTQVATVCAP